MTSELAQQHWNRVASIFDRAVDLATEERGPFLAQVCGSDRTLRTEIEEMLAASEPEHGLLVERKLLGLDDGSAAGATGVLPPGTRIGPYRIAEQVGAGGMGDVYRAERSDGSYRQTVAFKVLRPGYRTAEMTRRFRIERQALARLLHPGIATILDGGALDDGRPYLVLQFVDGVSITEYCARQRLTIEQRLRLFVKVADAVQFAHGQLVVHRDIKPSNILVEQDGAPRLLDFGIAKLLDPSPESSLAVDTRPEVRLLTPEYAAPEQLRGEPAQTRTDVYSLGALLFEMLTGQKAFPATGRTVLELERTILEKPAPTPSSVPAGTTGAPRLDADLDHIVLMALRKEPERRYQTVGQLADDVERYLAGRPVVAQPDTARYRARKFVARNRALVTAVVGALVVLAGFSLTIAVQARRAGRERDRAEQERTAAEDVVKILTGLFEKANPVKSPGGDTVRVATLLDDADKEVERLDDRSTRPARLWRAVGNMRAARGDYERALTLLRRSWERQRELNGPEDIEAARTYHELAQVTNYFKGTDAARPMLDSSLVELRRLLGEKDPDVRVAVNDLALVTSDPDKRRALLNEVVELERRHPGADSISIAALLSSQGEDQLSREKREEALASFEAALAILRQRLPADHPYSLTVSHNLAVTLGRLGYWARAESLQRVGLAASERTHAPPGARASAREPLALTLANLGRFAEAEPLERLALADYRAGLAADHPLIDNALRNLGLIVAARGRTEEGLILLDSAIAHADGTGPAGRLRSGYLIGQRVPLLLRMKRLDEAKRSLAKADPLVRAATREGADYRADLYRWTAMVAYASGDPAAAEAASRSGGAIADELGPLTSPWRAQFGCFVGVSLAALEQREEARRALDANCPTYERWGLADPLVREWIRAARSGLAAEHPRIR